MSEKFKSHGEHEEIHNSHETHSDVLKNKYERESNKESETQQKSLKKLGQKLNSKLR